MATLSSIISWKIPWMEELDGLQPMGLPGVECDLATEQQQKQIPSSILEK